MHCDIIFVDEVPKYLQFKNNEVLEFKEITAEDLLTYRLSKQPGVVYKIFNRFFLISLTSSLNLNIKSKPHLCNAPCSRVCKDCMRTRDLTTAFQMRYGASFNSATLSSWRLEKYHYISEGVECFNMTDNSDSFLVFACSHYHKNDSQEINEKKMRQKINKAKVNLASLYFTSFNGTTAADLKKFLRELNSPRKTSSKK